MAIVLKSPEYPTTNSNVTWYIQLTIDKQYESTLYTDFTVAIIARTGSGSLQNSHTGDVWVRLNDSTGIYNSYITPGSPTATTSGTTMMYVTHSIKHSSLTATQTLVVEANITNTTWPSTASHTFTFTIPAIASKSTIASISGGTIGSNMTVNINKPTSSTTASVHVRVPGYSWKEVVSKSSGTSLSFTLPTSLVADMPNLSSTTAEVRLTTYSDSTSLGDNTWDKTITIPKSTISSVSGGTIGSTMTVNISRIHSNLTTSVWVSLGSSGWMSVASKQTSTSISFTVPNSLANQIPNSTSGSGSVIIRTHNGSADIEDTSKSVTFTVPDWMKYSITSVTAESDTTINGSSKFIKGKSKLKVTIATSNTNAYGATISQYKFTFNGGTYYGNGTQTGVINTTGTKTISVTVTDSRGRTAVSSTSITIHDYYNPTASISAYRCNSSGTQDLINGNYVKVTYSGDIASIDGKNTISITLSYRQSDSSTWTAYETLTSAVNGRVVTLWTFDLTKTYELRVQVRDYYTSTYKHAFISTATVPLDYRSGGTGIGIGRYCTTNNTIQTDKEIQLYSNTGDAYADLKFLYTSDEKQTIVWRGGDPSTSYLLRLYKSTSGSSSGTANLFDLYTSNNVYLRFANNYFANNIAFYANADGVSGKQISFSNSSTYLYFYNPSTSSHDLSVYNSDAGLVWRYYASSEQLTLKSGYGNTSDARLKYDFNEFDNWDSYYNFYMSLKPQTFKYINDNTDKTFIGFKAQDVADSIVESGLNNEKLCIVKCSENEEMDDGREYSIAYQEFIPLNIKMIQKHEKDIQELKDKVALFKETVKKLKKSE